jgi:hypothetical protein
MDLGSRRFAAVRGDGRRGAGSRAGKATMPKYHWFQPLLAAKLHPY